MHQVGGWVGWWEGKLTVVSETIILLMIYSIDLVRRVTGACEHV